MVFDQIAAKRAVRYLKRGVFPPDAIERFTVGRDKPTQHIVNSLTDVQHGSSKHCFVEANYGLGKSQMLKLSEFLALQMGFAVSWVTINGSEHAFNHPSRYLHSFLENLRVPGVTTRGLFELCTHWLANSERDNLLNWSATKAPWEFRWPIDRLSSSYHEDDNGCAEWYLSKLEGRDLQHKSGCNYFAEVYGRLEATVSLCRAVGCNGVLFLFDEVECIATHMNNIRSRLLSYQILNTLADGRRFPHTMFLFATTEDLGVRISNDVLYYSQHEAAYPDGYRFARKWHAKEINALPVKVVGKAENVILLQRIRETHALAYSWQPETRILDAFIDLYTEIAVKLGLSQREIVKWFVDILEVAHQHPTFEPLHHLQSV